MRTTVLILLFSAINYCFSFEDYEEKIYIDQNFFETFENDPMIFVNDQGDSVLQINAYDDVALKFVMNFEDLEDYERVAKQDLFSKRLGAETEENYFVSEYEYRNSCDCSIYLRINLEKGVCFLSFYNQGNCFNISTKKMKLKLINNEVLKKISRN